MGKANLIERLMDCWNTGNLDGIDQMLSADFVRHEPDLRTSSIEDYKENIRHYHTALADFHTESMDTIAQGNKVVLRFRTTGKKDNVPVVFEGVTILRIDGEKIVEDWVYFDATGVQRSWPRRKARKSRFRIAYRKTHPRRGYPMKSR